jgi:hypothetical protein
LLEDFQKTQNCREEKTEKKEQKQKTPKPNQTLNSVKRTTRKEHTHRLV